MSDFKKLYRCHPYFLLCQFIQSLERVLDIRISQQFLKILLWSTISRTDSKARTVGSLLFRPCRISLVAMAKTFSTSTIIFTILSVIAAVGGTSVYVSRRLKKFSKSSEMSIRASCAALTSLTAWRLRCQSWLRGDVDILTWRRTPAPVKMTVAGEKTYVVTFKV